MKGKILLSLAASLLLARVASLETHCNAHIDLTQEETQVSFDKMYLEIYSQSGSRQESSQCTPDGNCFTVVYNLDSFIVRMKGPQGSVFEPSEYRIDTNKGQSCDDLGFKLKGFSLKHGVKSQDSQGKTIAGPSGLNIEIRRQGSKNQQAFDTQTTDSNGNVEFKDISIPDTYKLKIKSNDDLTFNKEEISCQFQWETGFICESNHFLIEGFSVQGKVVSYNDPMPNVNVYLHQGHSKIAYKSSGAQQTVKTDPNGVYKFTGIKSGQYQVVVVYSENQSKFQVEPDTIKFNIEGKSVTLEAFQVIGFSISGKVVNNKGEGISGVKIIIDGQQKALTNNQGNYKLDEITPGQYVLEGQANHYVFDSMNININSNSRTIQNLVATYYHLCGRVSVDSDEQKSFTVGKRTIVLSEKSKSERRTTTNDDGEFCFEVKSGVYTVSPLVTADEKEKGLKFNPSEKQVTVEGQPQMNINFGQTKLPIVGTVKCLDSSDIRCKEITVQLLNQDNQVLSTQGVDQNGKFKFEKLLPGKYRLKLDQPELCWKNDQIEVNLMSDDQNALFEQVGYTMRYESSHPFDITITSQSDQKVEKKNIQATKDGVLCISSKGKFTLTPVSCFKFSEKSFEFDTDAKKQQKLVFKPTHLKVEGKVQLKDESQISQVTVQVLDAKDNKKIEDLPLKKESSTSFKFEYFSPVDKNLVIQPTIKGGANILFSPKSKQINVGGECLPPVTFESKTGHMVEGKVEPATEGVLISILNKKSKAEITSVYTDAKGNYKVGPLYDDQEYDIEATKEDYIIKKEGKNFKAQKLSTLNVSIQDQNGEPLEQVSLQVSAGKGFRVTGSSNAQGQFKFTNLKAGKYYVTAILKEYDFGQSSFQVEIEDGVHTEKVFKAKRVAFSAFGQVNKISGTPLNQGRIVAKCEDCERVEEANIDQDGFFRVRGLLPNHKYTLQVQSSGIDRTVPSSITIDVKEQDSKNHQFLAIMQSPHIEVSGTVTFEGEDQKLVYKEDPQAVVELYDPDNLDKPLRSWQLSLSRYFQFNQLPRKDYVLRVIPKRGVNDKRYEQTVFKVDQKGGFQSLVIPSHQKGKTNFQRSALVGPVVFILVVLAIFYQDKIKKALGIDAESQSQSTTSQRKPGYRNVKQD